jgi:signal transduction histidine kinase
MATVGVVITTMSGAHGTEAPFFGFLLLVFGVVGALLAARRSDNPIGWIFVSTAVVIGLSSVLDGIQARLAAAGDSWEARGEAASTAARVLEWTEAWTWIPLIFVPIVFPLLLFPDGHLPSPRWRPFLWAALIGIPAFALSMSFDPANYPNGIPVAIDPPAWIEALGFASFLLIAAVIAGAVAVVTRFLRSHGTEREQIKWLAFGGIVGATCLAGAFIAGGVLTTLGIEADEGTPVADALNTVILVGLTAIPISIGFAILRYRLYDIDVVIRKTIVFGILVVLIMFVSIALYLAMSSVLTDLVTDETLAVGWVGLILGLLIFPLWGLARRIADRLVYGGRVAPSEVLSGFADRLAETYAIDDVLPRMAAIVAEATRAVEVRVWVRVGVKLREAAAWPRELAGAAPVPAPTDALPDLPGVSHATEIRDRGELLGAVSLVLPANDPIDTGRARLVRNLASQAGLVLRNVRLIQELQASRQRLVAAQDAERRRLERNIHDGAQQQLVSLAVQLRLLEQQIERDAAAAKDTAARLQRDAATMLEDLRDLARGIYPPLLADRGLGPALEAQARKASVPVSVDADGVGRYAPEVEASVYFCTLEALNNVAKHAEAARATVWLADVDRELRFEVSDDGRGFDSTAGVGGTGLQGMADRLAAIGGAIEIRSAPGRGTSVAGRIPLEVRR